MHRGQSQDPHCDQDADHDRSEVEHQVAASDPLSDTSKRKGLAYIRNKHNKKVLLRERKRHTGGGVPLLGGTPPWVSPCQTCPGGTPSLPGGTPPRVPRSGLTVGYPRWGTPSRDGYISPRYPPSDLAGVPPITTGQGYPIPAGEYPFLGTLPLDLAGVPPSDLAGVPHLRYPCWIWLGYPPSDLVGGTPSLLGGTPPWVPPC